MRPHIVLYTRRVYTIRHHALMLRCVVISSVFCWVVWADGGASKLMRQERAQTTTTTTKNHTIRKSKRQTTIRTEWSNTFQSCHRYILYVIYVVAAFVALCASHPSHRLVWHTADCAPSLSSSQYIRLRDGPIKTTMRGTIGRDPQQLARPILGTCARATYIHRTLAAKKYIYI